MIRRTKFKRSIMFSVICITAMIFIGEDSGLANFPRRRTISSPKEISHKLLKIWGGESASNEEEMFNEPRDIQIGKDGQFYILDTGNKRIQVFNSERKYVRSLGRPGQGPGEYSRPIELAIDANDNLYIGDESTSKIYKLSNMGAYIGGFSIINNGFYRFALRSDAKIILPNWSSSIISDDMFFIYDESGKIINGIGKIAKDDLDLPLRTLKYNAFFATDLDMNCYVIFLWRPLLQKYSATGKLIYEIKLDMPFKIPEITRRTLVNKDAEQVSHGIAVGPEKRIFTILLNRAKKGEERLLGGSIGGRGIPSRTYKHHLTSETTDLYRLVVFDKDGRMIASWNLDVYCNKIRIHKDRIFIIDSFVSMCIYEYEVKFESDKG